MDPVEPVEPGMMRASDADRDRVADRLREALAEGRLTPEEHAERIDAVFAAKTYAELEPLLQDLPDPATPEPPVRLEKDGRTPAQPPPRELPATVVAVLGAAERKGRWLVEPHTTVTCVLSAIKLDFRQAVLSQAEVTVNITCVLGSVEVVVPYGVRVVNSAAAIAGSNEAPDDDVVEPGAPVVRLTGINLLGAIAVKRKQAKKPKKSRRDRREHLRELGDARRRSHRE